MTLTILRKISQVFCRKSLVTFVIWPFFGVGLNYGFIGEQSRHVCFFMAVVDGNHLAETQGWAGSEVQGTVFKMVKLFCMTLNGIKMIVCTCQNQVMWTKKPQTNQHEVLSQWVMYHSCRFLCIKVAPVPLFRSVFSGSQQNVWGRFYTDFSLALTLLLFCVYKIYWTFTLFFGCNNTYFDWKNFSSFASYDPDTLYYCDLFFCY